MPNKVIKSKIIFSDIKSSFKDCILYFLSLFVKNKVIKKTPRIYQYGDASFKQKYKIENINDNEKIFNKWFNLLLIKTNANDSKMPIKKTDVMFKLVKLRPCKVDMIFQIDRVHVKKKEEMIKNIARDLNFISPLSN